MQSQSIVFQLLIEVQRVDIIYKYGLPFTFTVLYFTVYLLKENHSSQGVANNSLPPHITTPSASHYRDTSSCFIFM